MKRLIFVNRYYKPDHSATAQILADLAENLARTGDRPIHIVTSRLSYDDPDKRYPAHEHLARVEVHRVWTSSFGRHHLAGRAVDYLTFYVSALFCLLRLARRGDTVVAKTDPPLISVAAAMACWLKGAKLINWLQDLFPEVAVALKVKFADGPVGAFLKVLRNWSLRQAEMNVAIGELMKERVVREGIPEEKVTVISNWVVGPEIHPVDRDKNPLRKEWGLDGKFVVGYSGNLGRAHDYQTMLAAAEALKDTDDIRFVFIGGGAGMDLLKQGVEEKQLPNVLFKPYQPIERLSESLSVPDVHLITLQPALEGLIVPSKFYGVLAVQRPIIYIGDGDGEIGRTLAVNALGLIVGSGQIAELTGGIEKLRRAYSRPKSEIVNVANERLWQKVLSGASRRRPRVAIVYHYIAHYRVPIFDRISKNEKYEFTIISGSETDVEIRIAQLDKYGVTPDGRYIRWKQIVNKWLPGGLLWQKGLLSLLRREKYDHIIFMGNAYFLTTWIVMFYRRVLGRPNFMWGHGILKAETGLKKFFRKAFYSLVDVHFVYSQRSIDLLKASGLVRSKYVHIYNSLDYESSREIRRVLEVNLPQSQDKELRLVFIGRLTPQKKLPMLIDVMRALSDENDLSVSLAIVGDGPELEKLKQLARDHGLERSIDFKGAIYDEVEIARILLFSDVCISPGEVGLTAIHSLTYGTPVFTHGNFDKQMPEYEAIVPGKTGQFFQQDNVVDLVHKLKEWMHAGKARERVRADCINAVESYFTPASQEKIFVDVLDGYSGG